MYSQTFVKVSVTVAVADGADGSQYSSALEVSWPRLGAMGVSMCLAYVMLPGTTHDMVSVWCVQRKHS